MNNAIFNFVEPAKEPVFSYLQRNSEREIIEAELARQNNTIVDIPLITGGRDVRTGKTGRIVLITEP